MNWQIEEFMVYCRSRQLRAKTMASYEQTLRLFERWCICLYEINIKIWQCTGKCTLKKTFLWKEGLLCLFHILFYYAAAL